ncbi:sensor histidine kinase [Psychrobacter sp. PSP]|jgi:signal transduction histidine kinase|uniref:sensor histidine kinase n=1 Tax=Psychrobacter TaxID=497 RepID=UPI002096357A|nr:sensor histidine kinase [Psychrobacter sp. PSP]
MQQLGFRSVFAKLFASVMLALILFAVAMVLLTQLVHDKDAGIRSEILATQILGQIDPFLHELNISISKDNHLQSRFMLAVVKKSFDIFDESLQAKMGLYDSEGRLLMQTDNSDLPLELPPTPSLFSRVFPSLADTSPTKQAQVYSSTGYTLLYESRLPPKKPVLSAALNLFTGTLLLLIIMAGVLWLIARTMTWRIDQLSQQMAQLGDGDFTVRVNARGNDEIASLAKGFNQAAQKIEHLVDANNLLLAHASHELRTPITRIRLQIEMMDMLASGLPADTKSKFDKRAHAITRDLSGLNDLVESILLVSRLDAGHALQQIENLDLYDLVNQERQHYPEATLIGEHIMIDGQSSMLTHLIRNLLTNAMLHGKPPVTVLLYGVQTIEDAGTVPDYLLQTVLSSSFTDYNSLLDFDSYEGSLDTNSDEQESASPENADSTLSNKDKIDSVEPIAVLPAPPIYKNGENLTVDEDVNADLNFIKNTPSSVKPNAHIASTDLDKVIWKAVPDSKDTLDSNKGVHDNLIESTDGTIDNRAHALENDSNRKTDKVATDTTIHKNGSKDKAKNSAKANTQNNNEAAATPRKEGLFAKHLKKAKTEPVRPLPKYAVLAVIDEGTGIPEEKREEVFSPFVRLQQKNKGSGLGLSLVSQIVTAHQGRITTDTLNGHTRFLVAIPVEHDPHYNQHE